MVVSFYLSHLSYLSHLVNRLFLSLLEEGVEMVLKALQSYKHHCYVVQSFVMEGHLHNIFDGLSAELMDVLKESPISPESIPDGSDDFGITELIEYPIAFILTLVHPKIMKSSSSPMVKEVI